MVNLNIGHSMNTAQYQDPVFINNAGLIILAPFLANLFEKCGLTSNNEFINEQSKNKAIHLLDYAATGNTTNNEHQLIINKLLCGMSVSDPIMDNINLSNEDKEIVDGLLIAVLQQWTVLKNTSIEGLRNSFLQRDGRLEEGEEQYCLKVSSKAFDILLDQLPWSISNIKLYFMKKPFLVEWRS